MIKRDEYEIITHEIYEYILTDQVKWRLHCNGTALKGNHKLATFFHEPSSVAKVYGDCTYIFFPPCFFFLFPSSFRT